MQDLARHKQLPLNVCYDTKIYMYICIYSNHWGIISHISIYLNVEYRLRDTKEADRRVRQIESLTQATY